MTTAPSVLGPHSGLDRHTLLFGRDDTPGIVSIVADRRGRARVWRRVNGRVVGEEDGFPNWFFLARRELLDGLTVVETDPSALETKPAVAPGTVGLVRLRGDYPFSYLVLTDRLDEVQARVTEAARRGNEDGSVPEPVSELIYVRPVAEQYLTITGRTYFKGMTYADVRRLQFDLETTGLGVDHDRIFMVSIKDSDGFATILDVGAMDEAELIRELVRIIRERDPDVIENHNIFDFDIKFLIKRAHALDVPLPLGRDGSEFWESRDSVKIGGTSHSFTRYSLAGREIIDTLQATRRFSAIQRDLRSNGLKEAAKYFGFAADDREYVDGAEIWRVYQEDPDRVRRYCMDDVEEVDRLSRLLLAPSFALASMVPKSYERIATAGTGQGLIEPLLVRAYVASGCSLPTGKGAGSFAGAITAVFTTGVVHNVVKADVASLYPSIMLSGGIGPASDHLGAFLALLRELTTLRLHHKAEARSKGWESPAAMDGQRTYHDAMQSAMKVLINSFYGMLGANFALFCDKAAAERVAARGREILHSLLEELERREAVLIEADTDGVFFSLPLQAEGRECTYEEELALIDEISRAMPSGIQVEHDGRFRAMYSYLEKNYALLDYEEEVAAGFRRREPIRLVGVSFRSAKTEPYIERFLAEALRLILQGDLRGVRDAYRSTCARLRSRRISAADLCVTMPLTKTPETYARADRKEEAYEVYLAAGQTAWRPGLRIRYYQAKGGKKLLQPGVNDYDGEFYIGRLRNTCRQRLEKAFRPDDLEVLLSESDGLFDPPLEDIRPLCERRAEPLSLAATVDEDASSELEG